MIHMKNFVIAISSVNKLKRLLTEKKENDFKHKISTAYKYVRVIKYLVKLPNEINIQEINADMSQNDLNRLAKFYCLSC